MKNRIRDLRKARRMSQDALGARVGLGKWDISRLETGVTQLKLETARKVAQALDANLAEVLGIDDDRSKVVAAAGFAESDLIVYNAPAGDPFAALATENRYLMKAATDALDLIGIKKGDLLIVDGSAAICKTPPALAAVRVQYHPDPDEPGKALTLLRQFVPPRLVIVNSSTVTAQNIDLERDDAQILGVVVSFHRQLG